jgi:hypothetical protein
MAAFTGHNIFPGLRSVGLVPEALRAGLVVYTASALDALNSPVEESVAWADAVSHVTTGDFEAKIPIDITSLEGFQEDKGRDYEYKQVDLMAIDVASVQFYLACSWKSALVEANVPMANVANKGAQVIAESRALKAQMAATVLMQGRPGGKALTYAQEGSPQGLTLFNTAHLINPHDITKGTFSNYWAAAGKFDAAMLKKIRTYFRMVRGPSSIIRTLGLQLTEILIPSHMEERVRDVAISSVILQVAQVGGTAVAGGVTNTAAVSAGAPWSFRVVPELDYDPYLVAFRAAFLIANGRQPEPEELPDLLIAISGTRPGASAVEMLAPSTAFVPRVNVLGIGSEHEIKTSEVAIIAKQRCGAAAGLPYVCLRIEQT